jgi:2-methylcitrate dehydratase PrpD
MPTTTGSSVTTGFCAAMLDAATGPLPPDVSRAARRTLLNVIGTAASAVTSPAVTVLLAAAAQQGSAGDVPVPGLARTLDPYWGALVTGTAAHLDDFDDTHLATVIHPGAAALATVLSLAPETAPSGAAFLGAFAVGCEAQLRIGNAISPAHYDQGWHITGTCGVFGAAAAASALLGLDAEAAGRALSLAATMTLGHREAFGSMTKPLHAGKAAANGVLAARLAAAGLGGPPDPLGPGGVLEALAAAVDRDALSRGWELELNTFKTYPCGVVAHPAMDAAIAVSDQVDPATITAITLRCHPLVPELMGTVQPEDGLRSRFSARHGVAVGLLFGQAGLAEFSDAVATAPEVARLRGLITLDPDPAMARDAADLRIETGSGWVEAHTEHTRGSAARPLTDSELRDKVRALTDPVLGDGAADRIREAVDNLPTASDVAGFFASLRPMTPEAPGASHNLSAAGASRDNPPAAGAPGLRVFTASHRRHKEAPNDAASHPRRPAPATSPDSLPASRSAPTSPRVGAPGPDVPANEGAGSLADRVAVAGTTTDRLLALAANAAPTLPAVKALARFTAAVTTQQGIAIARTLVRALRPVDADGAQPAPADTGGPPPPAPADRPVDGGGLPPASEARPVSAALPAGAALTAWVTGAAAVAALASDDDEVAMVVCAAARALGDDCLAAVAAGLEGAALVEAGLDGCAGPGWSVPVVAGIIGAGLAAGVMAGLTEAQLRNALGVCATQAAGLCAADGTDAGALQGGKAAFNAVEGALLARAGFTAAAEPLDGRRGLFALFREG